MSWRKIFCCPNEKWGVDKEKAKEKVATAATGGSSQMSIILARHAVADRNHPKGKVAQAGPQLQQFGASVARTCKHVAHERSCR